MTPEGKVRRSLDLARDDQSFHSVIDPQGRAGDLYRYYLEGVGSFPDPASRYQPDGVHGPSMVVDPATYRWKDAEWRGPDIEKLIFYELHIGTFTDSGTFLGAKSKLPYLVDLGITAIELMPLADFPGQRNWGYDGVSFFAPARAYGTPDDLRKLVDGAHALGLAVFLDVVYNHFGPDGNYLGTYHPGYYHPTHKTPWGPGLNYQSPPVRNLIRQNAAYWLDEFHFDGLRLDATHAIEDPSEVHILREIGELTHARDRIVIAEDERNDPSIVRNTGENGVGLDGCWADDLHHVIHVGLTKGRDAFYQNYEGTPEQLALTLHQGWLFGSQVEWTEGKASGGRPGGNSSAEIHSLSLKP